MESKSCGFNSWSFSILLLFRNIDLSSRTNVKCMKNKLKYWFLKTITIYIMLSIIFLWGVILFCSIPLGLFILNNLKVSYLSRSFDKFFISFWIGISIIALIQLFLSGWFVLTFWFPLAFSLFSIAILPYQLFVPR